MTKTRMNSYSIRQFGTAGLEIDDLAEMSLSEIAQIDGISPSSVGDYAEYSGRTDEWNNCRYNPDYAYDIDGMQVTFRDVIEYGRRRETLDHFDVQSELDGVDGYNDRRRKLLVEIDHGQIAAYIAGVKRKERPKKSSEPQTADEIRERILHELNREYDTANAPINDRMQVEHLASLMSLREINMREMHKLMEAGQVDSRKVKDLQAATANVDRQILSIQDSLRINPAGRQQAEASYTPQQYLKDVLARMKQWLGRYAVLVQVDGIHMGTVVWHFPDDDYAPHCAKCGHDEFTVRSPRGGKRSFRFYTQEAAESYVRASDFIPDDAPPDHPFGRLIQMTEESSKNGTDSV